MFIASKVASGPALLAQLRIEAPDGLLFGIPNRSLIIYRIPTDFADLIGIAQMMSAFTPEAGFDDPGDLISAEVYYWSPNGLIESMMGDFDESMKAAADVGTPATDMPPEFTTALRPNEEFTTRFMKS